MQLTHNGAPEPPPLPGGYSISPPDLPGGSSVKQQLQGGPRKTLLSLIILI